MDAGVGILGKRRIKRRGDEISKHMMSRNGMGWMVWAQWNETDGLRWGGKSEKTRQEVESR